MDSSRACGSQACRGQCEYSSPAVSFQEQLRQSQGSFAGRRERPGETASAAQSQLSGWTVLNPLALPGSDGRQRFGQHAPLACRRHGALPRGVLSFEISLEWQVWRPRNTLSGMLSLRVVTAPSTTRVVEKPRDLSVVSPGLQATAGSVPELRDLVQPTCRSAPASRLRVLLRNVETTAPATSLLRQMRKAYEL